MTACKFILLLIILIWWAAPAHGATPCIKHAFTSEKSDPTDATLIKPSDWNACHTIDDGGIPATKIAASEKPIWFSAAALHPDGTNCAPPTEQTLNSGPVVWAFSCADSDSSIIYGVITMPTTWNAGTVTFTTHLFHATTESITFAIKYSAACRAAGATIDGTYGTAVAGNVSITTANVHVSGTTGAVTPNGSCAAGDMLYFKGVIDSANFDANAANAKVLGVTLNATY